MITNTRRVTQYFFSRNDMRVQSECMKAGYIVYPTFKKGQKWQRHWPKIILVYSYKGRRYPLISEPFPQGYLGFEMNRYYHQLYNKKVLHTAPVPPTIRKPAFPQGPPTSKMLPPPPPPKKEGIH